MQIIIYFISRCINLIQYFYGLISGKSLFYINVHKWFALDGNENHLINYELDATSTVMEVGWYKWVFTDDIISKFDCNLYIFEPIRAYYDILVEKYKNNSKVHIYRFGLGKENGTLDLWLLDDGTSAFKSGKTETVDIKKLSEFLAENKISNVDLISINIEWGEYDLLEDMISTESVGYFKNIQVQFHDFVTDAQKLRESYIQKLSKTHNKTYSFPFVWEWFIHK